MSSANDELALFIRCSATDPNDSEYMLLEYKNQDINGDSNRPRMSDVEAAAAENQIDSYEVRFVLVPYDAVGSHDYAVTFGTLAGK